METLASIVSATNREENAYWGSGGLHYTFLNTPLTPWTHYAVAVDASGTITSYANGTAAGGTFSNSAALPAVSRALYRKSTHPSDPLFNGYIRDFQLALGSVFCATDVANLFAGNGCPQPPPPSSSPPAPPAPPPPPPSPTCQSCRTRANVTTAAAALSVNVPVALGAAY